MYNCISFNFFKFSKPIGRNSNALFISCNLPPHLYIRFEQSASNMPEKVRVAIIIPRLVQLGPILMIKELVNSLCALNLLKIKVFYLDKKVDPLIKILAPVERLRLNNFPFSEYDIVHTNGIRPDLFAFINRRKIKYHISTIHNFVFDDLTYTYNKIISLIFGNVWLILWKRADRLVCISEAMKSYYKKWYKSSKLLSIYNGISEPDESLVPDDDIIQIINRCHSNGLKVIGTASILSKRKGIDQFLEMLVVEKEISLIVIGNGDELGKLQYRAEQLKISDRCYFTGFRRNANIYFKYFDIFVMPSRSEGFGISLVEAVQQQVPVICSDIQVFRELFSEEEATFFNFNDLSSLNLALKDLLDKGKAKSVSAYRKYQNNYTSDRMAKEYYDLYRSA